MLVILARHGETAWNLENRYQGWLDSPLTGTGKKQAEEVGEALKKYKIDRLYSSPLGRALSTAKIIANANACEIAIEPMLKEINYGIFEGKLLKEVAVQYQQIVKKRETEKYSYKIPEGESFGEMEKGRIRPFVEKLFSENKNDTTIVIVAHAGANKLIMGNLAKITGKKIFEIYQPNNCIYFLEAEKGKKAKISYAMAAGEKKEGYIRLPQLEK